jgi:hypothetical protein
MKFIARLPRPLGAGDAGQSGWTSDDLGVGSQEDSHYVR